MGAVVVALVASGGQGAESQRPALQMREALVYVIVMRSA